MTAMLPIDTDDAEAQLMDVMASFRHDPYCWKAV